LIQRNKLDPVEVLEGVTHGQASAPMPPDQGRSMSRETKNDTRGVPRPSQRSLVAEKKLGRLPGWAGAERGEGGMQVC